MVDYTIAIINIDLTINKMMFRLKLEDLSDRKREGIETIIKDLKHASEVIKTLNKAVDEEHKKNTPYKTIEMFYSIKIRLPKSKIKQYAEPLPKNISELSDADFISILNQYPDHTALANNLNKIKEQ